ncbi:MAG TPA: hypothetical protein VGG46_13775 [Terriglobales bacterium]
MAKKNAPTITSSLLTTIARTVGTTAGLIVNKTAELTEVAAQAAGMTMKAGRKSAANKKKASASATKKRAPQKTTARKKKAKAVES